MTGERRLAFFYPYGMIDSIPGLVSGISVLAGQGYVIDLFVVDSSKFTQPDFGDANVQVRKVALAGGGGIGARVRRVLDWTAVLLRSCRGKEFHGLVGVDPRGLIMATLVGFLLRRPVAYWSLEIYPAAELRTAFQKAVKACERWCNRAAFLTITQDQDRAQLLARENKVPRDRMCLVPNAPLGHASGRRTDYLRRKYGLAAGQKVILHAGSVAPCTMSVELARAARSWPESWTLVFQNRQRMGEDPYGRMVLGLADGKRIVVASEPVGSGDLAALVASADVGIALYQNGPEPELGENLTTMGLSSGKIAQYLQCGLPIVTVDFPSLKRLVDTSGCGVAVGAVEQVEGAIQLLLTDHERYSQAAIACFEDRFLFTEHFQAVVNRLEAGGSAVKRHARSSAGHQR